MSKLIFIYLKANTALFYGVMIASAVMFCSVFEEHPWVAAAALIWLNQVLIERRRRWFLIRGMEGIRDDLKAKRGGD